MSKTIKDVLRKDEFKQVVEEKLENLKQQENADYITRRTNNAEPTTAKH